MKKILVLLLAMLMLVPCFSAIAEETATALPLNTAFSMDYETLRTALGKDAVEDLWDEGTGTLMLEQCAIGIGDLKADSIHFQVDRNNSDKASRLSQISINLPTSEKSIASFREALTALTDMYGQPDSDPFDAASVENYVEYGGLSATWTKPDVRISLSLSRMFQESINLDFTNRLCYSADDLK
ncbi:MAG: hypothetical protein RSE58_10660 [Clostridia bacterium]